MNLKDDSNTYEIKNLPPGEYYFRMRAISLEGYGSFTEYEKLTISNLNNYSSICYSLYYVTIIFIFFNIILIVIVCICKKNNLHKVTPDLVVVDSNEGKVISNVYIPNNWLKTKNGIQLSKKHITDDSYLND